MSTTTRLFPDVKSIFAEKMAEEVMKGLGTEIAAHYSAAKKNNIPAQAAHVAALDAVARTAAELIRAVVPEKNRSAAIAEFVTQIELHATRSPEVKS